jgi:two-component system, chemotaxis family, response regulator Rcp1
MKTTIPEILLVEDNPHDTLLVIRAIGENPAYHLRAVEDGEQAMAYLRRKEPYSDATQPAIILLDLRLPKKSGFEILTEIKQDEALKETPVIVLTNAGEDEVLGNHAAHIHAYVQKPLDPTRFIKVVQQAVAFCLGNYNRPPLN